MTPERFKHLIRELVEENPFAIRPFLKVGRVRFTEEIPTLAVTCQDSPELQVNLRFLKAHCRSDAEVKAVILHEFLHILLRHTERRGPINPAEHLATDAVINAIIHRHVGPEASAMMARYYGEVEGFLRLLRPPRPEEIPLGNTGLDPMLRAWRGLYGGQLVVDDIRELAEGFDSGRGPLEIDLGRLLGNHQALGDSLPAEFDGILKQVMRSMDGGGIWRSPVDRGLGVPSYEALVAGTSQAIVGWERAALRVLLKHLQKDSRSRAMEQHNRTSLLPVLSPGDRRAHMQALWSPVLPTAKWDHEVARPMGSAQVYLDVSGSMNAEMGLVIGLLNRLRRFIRMPFWAFSNQVCPAHIEGGVLKTSTTGGTSLTCVLEHITRTRPESAVIVTDGYIEEIPRALVLQTASTRIHTLLTRDGSPLELDRAGLSYTQLPKVPA